MNKKSFKDNPALAFIGTQQYAQEDAQEGTQQHTQEDAQEVNYTAAVPLSDLPPSAVTAPVDGPRREYVRTQGRKGSKKPRINLAFDSDAFLDSIRDRADRDGKSITQLVNEAVAYYLDKTI